MKRTTHRPRLLSIGGASLLAALGLVLLPAGGEAQQFGETSKQKIFCLTDSQPDLCKMFLVTETLVAQPLAQDARLVGWSEVPIPDTPETLFERELEWQAGPMINLDEDWAIGGIIGVGTGSDNALSSATVRARRWLQPNLALDFSAGWIFRDRPRPEVCQSGFLSDGCIFPQGRITGNRIDARMQLFDSFHWGFAWERLNVEPYYGETSADEGGSLDAFSVFLGAGSETAVVVNGVLLAGFMAFFN